MNIMRQALAIAILGVAAILAMLSPVTGSAAPGVPSVDEDWVEFLDQEVRRLERAYPGKFGLYMKRLSDDRVFSHRGSARWYIASGVKVPIAVEALVRASEGKISLSDRIDLSEDDYVDGAGQTNYHPPGSSLSIRYLLQQMLVYSDNTAADLLLRKVGLQSVNERVKVLAPEAFGEITELSEVRRLVYRRLHPRARGLRGKDLLVLASFHQGKRAASLAALLGVERDDLRLPSIGAAFSAYYRTGVNSATLEGYARILERIAKNEVLDPLHTKLLLEWMDGVKTGRNRLIAAFPNTVVFAHKTGTQFQRICDFGVARKRGAATGKGVVIAACVQGLPVRDAELVLRRLGASIRRSGVFSSGSSNSG